MIFKCSGCNNHYDEIDQDQIRLGQSDCEMICCRCAKSIWDDAKKYIIQPERLSEKDRKVCDSPIIPTKGSEPNRND
jgi:hypothetical protein